MRVGAIRRGQRRGAVGPAATMLAAWLVAGCSDDVEDCGAADTRGVSCDEVLPVPCAFGFSEALAQARAGSCVVLEPGTYGEGTLPGGAKLIGPGADQVTVGSLTLPAGQGSAVHGVHVAGVVKVRPDAIDVQLTELLVTGSQNGIQAESGASVTVEDVEVLGVPNMAVAMVDAARLTLRRIRIAAGEGPGLWAQCSAGCGCASPPQVELEEVDLADNRMVGVALMGVSADLTNVAIGATDNADGFTPYSVGLSASHCTNLTATGLDIDGGAGAGLLVASATALLRAGDTPSRIANNVGGGVWIGDTDDTQGAHLQDVLLDGNGLVGIAVDAQARAVVIEGGEVTNTAQVMVPANAWVSDGSGEWVYVPVGSAAIGDGVIWRRGAEVHMDGVTLGGSGRIPMLIDGSVAPGSQLHDVTLEAGDELTGIVQQTLPGIPAAPPETSGTTPPVQQLDGAPHVIPEWYVPPEPF